MVVLLPSVGHSVDSRVGVFLDGRLDDAELRPWHVSLAFRVRLFSLSLFVSLYVVVDTNGV